MAVTVSRSTEPSSNSSYTFYEKKRCLIAAFKIDPTPERPHSPLPDGELEKVRQSEEIDSTLSKFLGIIKIFIEAYSSFEKGEFHNFDPVVGDGACLPRAFMVLETNDFLKPKTNSEMVQAKYQGTVSSYESNSEKYLKTNERLLEKMKKIQSVSKTLSEQSELSQDTQNALLESMKAQDQLRLQKESEFKKEKERLGVIKQSFEGKTSPAIVRKTSFEDHFKVENIDQSNIFLPTFMMFIGFSYFLTKSKIPKTGGEETDLTKLLASRGITRDTTNPLIFQNLTKLTSEQLFQIDKVARKVLAALIIERFQSFDLMHPLKTFSKPPYVKVENGKLVLPAYLATLSLKEYYKFRFPLVLNLKNSANQTILVYFHPTSVGYTSHEVTHRYNDDKPLIEMVSISTKPLEYIDIAKQDIYELILENEAVHPQQIEWIKDKSTELTKKSYEDHESKGKKGCSLEDPSKIFISHYRPSSMKKLTEFLPN